MFRRSLTCLMVLLPWAARAEAAPQQGGGIPDGWMIIEEDIMVPIDFYTSPAPWAWNLWPGGVVPYVFDANMGNARRQLALAAMAEWELYTNVQFVERTNEPDYFHMRSEFQNSSAVGRVGGMQIINIKDWEVHYTIVHELGHCLGFWHEHSREDRDSYIQVNFGNVCQTCCGGSCNFNFNIMFGSGRYGPYNFDSFMHYGQFQASGNGLETITVLPPWDVEWQDQIGQRDHMSVWDARGMSFLYPDPDWRFVDWTDMGSTETGGFFEPYRDFWQALSVVPAGGQVIVLEPDSAIAPGVIDQPVTLRAPMGGVVIR